VFFVQKQKYHSINIIKYEFKEFYVTFFGGEATFFD
jgi:hypothetical protein